MARSEELDTGTLVDLDHEGRVIGIEVIRPSRLWPASVVIERFGLDASDRAMLEALYPIQVGHQGPLQPRGQEVASDGVGLDPELLSA